MLIGVGDSQAASKAVSNHQSIVATTSWAVVALGRNQTPSASPYILLWAVSTGTAYDYFSFRNLGSVTLNGFRVAITQVRLTGNSPANEIFFERCLGGTWDSATTLCSGTVVQIGKASDGFLLFSGLSFLSNAAIEMRARTVPNNQSTFETSLSSEVSRSNVRASQISNS